jgi:hypothetical protein
MLLPWAAGFIMYQLVNPGYVTWWVNVWASISSAVGFTAQSWMSASILSFAVAGLLTAAIGFPTRKLASSRG